MDNEEFKPEEIIGSAAEKAEESLQNVSDAAEEKAQEAAETLEKAEDAVENLAGDAVDAIESFEEKASETVEEAVENTGEAVAEVTETISETAGDVIESAGEAVESLSSEAAEALEELPEAVEETVEEAVSVPDVIEKAPGAGRHEPSIPQYVPKHYERTIPEEPAEEVPNSVEETVDVLEPVAGSASRVKSSVKRDEAKTSKTVLWIVLGILLCLCVAGCCIAQSFLAILRILGRS